MWGPIRGAGKYFPNLPKRHPSCPSRPWLPTFCTPSLSLIWNRTILLFERCFGDDGFRPYPTETPPFKGLCSISSFSIYGWTILTILLMTYFISPLHAVTKGWDLCDLCDTFDLVVRWNLWSFSNSFLHLSSISPLLHPYFLYSTFFITKRPTLYDLIYWKF